MMAYQLHFYRMRKLRLDGNLPRVSQLVSDGAEGGPSSPAVAITTHPLPELSCYVTDL